MSILYSNDIGFFVSHVKYINECYTNTFENSTQVKYMLKDELFKIDSPYNNPNKESISRQRKRKYNEDRSLEKVQEVSILNFELHRIRLTI